MKVDENRASFEISKEVVKKKSQLIIMFF